MVPVAPFSSTTGAAVTTVHGDGARSYYWHFSAPVTAIANPTTGFQVSTDGVTWHDAADTDQFAANNLYIESVGDVVGCLYWRIVYGFTGISPSTPVASPANGNTT